MTLKPFALRNCRMCGVVPVLMAAFVACTPITGISAFVVPNRHVPNVGVVRGMNTDIYKPSRPSSHYWGASFEQNSRLQKKQSSSAVVSYMYKLPPGGGGDGGDPLKDLKGLLPTIGTGAAILLFFLSPLGSIFFAITNSLFTLALLTPIILIGGFQAWQFLYTMEGPCPNCGEPTRVLKDDDQPGICLSCGTIVRATSDNSGLEICNNPNDIMQKNDSPFDDIFGGGGNGGSFADFFDTSSMSQPSMGNTTPKKESREAKAKREGTIIDIDVIEKTD
uniref:Uncharacterized protein n=1 Tax=Attheya septentrionalis TaxID=420275 RepID=A0A7S2UJJ4_9STRA|mmetsp:Transcript_2816/g.5119  ORF Transcript_2816/g.5119 Transcript_2816/m.5119 type:complete len:278 (+) Transcript_2816:139-972(+)|eukprot:CAMPEP_0198290324 /NCGR_PEP_ID=MMETSP1449-20131203/8247_1 /TAXON_ID=420275 /ORGANISM="Attheya septentrionalis, Strain CCMP2084" /LENGTH=277 /DNA_ID=CAMNT_0043988825 /DNA_START=116 /DNA_END=949 /DNA_ORIENTATION=+